MQRGLCGRAVRMPLLSAPSQQRQTAVGRNGIPEWSSMLKGAGLVLLNAAMPAFTEALREMRSVGESGSGSASE